jgi:hypothetical protein
MIKLSHAKLNIGCQIKIISRMVIRIGIISEARSRIMQKIKNIIGTMI